MELKPGDIILCDAPTTTTNHKKYHLCVLECGEDGTAACFLFLNSKSGWNGDCVLQNTDFPCLPPSKTGKSVVSFSNMVRYNPRKLKIYRAEKIGTIPKKTAQKLKDFAKTVPTLNKKEHLIVLNGLSKIK